jgi:hypothetical protein
MSLEIAPHRIPTQSTTAPTNLAPAQGVALPQGPAIFETSLQSHISSTDTSMTLVSTSTQSGELFPSGYNCFALDEGRSDADAAQGNTRAAALMTKLVDMAGMGSGFTEEDRQVQESRHGISRDDTTATDLIPSAIKIGDNLATQGNVDAAQRRMIRG